MPCREYEKRPRLCREFSCGVVPCEKCDACEGNVVIAVPGVIDDEDARYLQLHGLGVVQKDACWELHVKAPCLWNVKDAPCLKLS